MKALFTFLCFSFEYLVQIKLLKYYEYQLTKRCLKGRLEDFKVFSWFLKVTRPSFFRGYHPTLNLSGTPTFTFIVSLTYRMDNI